jgi:hypothetical protein
LPSDAVLVALISETLNSAHLPRRRAAEILINAVRAEERAAGLRITISLANPGLSKDVYAEIEQLIDQLELDRG